MKQYWNWIKLCLMFCILIISLGCTPAGNATPETPSISISSTDVFPEETVTLEALSVDADGDLLIYLWHAPAGTLSEARGPSTTWKAPKDVGTYDISVEVSDGRSRAVRKVTVQVINGKPGLIPAGTRYPPPDESTRKRSHLLFAEDTRVVPDLEDKQIEVRQESVLPAPVPYGELIIAIDIYPDGLSFTPPAQVNFQLPANEHLPGEILDVLLFDEQSKVWVAAGEATVGAQGEFAVGFINHTSVWALVKRTTAVSPLPTLPPPPTPIIPTSVPEETCFMRPPVGWNTYMVQRGDTLFSLSRRTGASIAMIQQVNCLNSTNLQAFVPIWLPITEESVPTATLVPTWTPTPPPTPTFTPTPTATPTLTPYPEMVDLVPGYEVFEVDVSCSGKPVTCVTEVRFDVTNLDYGSFSGQSNVMITMDPNQSVVVNYMLYEIAPFATEVITILSPPGGNCYDSNCEVCIIVDSNNAAVESNESNNKLCQTWLG